MDEEPRLGPRAGRAPALWAALAAVLLAAAAGLLWVFHARPGAGPAREDEPADVLTGKAGIEWVAIPGGRFLMGARDLGPDALPQRWVSVPGFRMARSLVTNQQYRACVQAGACTEPCDCGEGFAADEKPVVCVDWRQSRVFAQWAGGRLPSEAEWEYAARSAGRDWKFPWGDEAATCERAVVLGCSRDVTMPVCRRPQGHTLQGLCDMAGNAWEWVQDCYHGSYQGAPADAAAWELPPGAFRVMRGGSWFSDGAHARNARRSSRAWAYRNCHVGLRPARDQSP